MARVHSTALEQFLEYFLVMAAHRQDLYTFLLHLLPCILQHVAGIYRMYVGLMMNLGHVNILGYGGGVMSAQTTSSNSGGRKAFKICVNAVI